MRKSYVMAVAAMSILGCGNPTSASIANAVSGRWKFGGQPPGNYFGMTLYAHGTDLSGTGIVIGEAGPHGSSAITGAVVGEEVHLDFIITTDVPNGPPPYLAHFTGKLAMGSLRGSLQYGVAGPQNPPGPVVFTRSDTDIPAALFHFP